MSKEKIKVVAIIGTTASGKTKMGVDLCMDFDGEIVSADSRQVYRHMDIGSGKDLHEYKVMRDNKFVKIPYHLIDAVEPSEEYNLAKWLIEAKTAIDEINKRHKLPVVVGGTGLYVEALLDNYQLSEKGTDAKLRNELEVLNIDELLTLLSKIDKQKAIELNNSEKNNKRRLIRLIEISNHKETSVTRPSKSNSNFDSLIIGITWPREELKKRIQYRLNVRLEKEGMIEEVKALKEVYQVTSARLESFGLEYKYISLYLDQVISYEEMKEKIYFASCQFAKRQLTWLRRWEKQGADINWVDSADEARELLKKFLRK